MRIDCEQCGAAYNIDDALITERGVRAQCPKCGTQKVVKKQADGANPFAAMGGGGAAFGAPQAAANPFAPPSGGATNPFGAPQASANPFAAPRSDGPTMPNAPNPYAAPTQPSGNPFAVSQPSATQPSGNPFGAPQASATQPSGNPFGGAPAPVTAMHQQPVANPFAAPSAPFAAPSAPFAAPSAPFAAPSAPFAAPSAPFAAPSAPFAAPSAPSAPPAPTAAPFGAPSDPFGAAAKSSPFNPTAPMFGSPGSQLGRDPSDTISLPPNAPNPPSAASDPFAALGAGPSAAPAKDPFAALANSPARPAMGGGAPPRPSPSAPVDDPFAKLDLGGPKLADPTPSANGWRVKTRAGMDAEMDLANLRDLIKTGSVTPADEAAPVGQPLKAVSQWPLLNVATPAQAAVKVAGARARGGGGIPRAALLVVGVVAVAAVVGGIMIVKPELFESTTDAGVNPLRRAKPTWAKQFPDVSGTAQDHLNAGRAQAKLDTAAGYRKADEEFRQALLVDIGNVEAISAWVENFASLPAVKSDIEQANLAEEAIAFAARKAPDSTDAMRAQAALKLAHGDVDGTQKVLTLSTQKAPNDTAAFLILARSHLDRNAQDALDILETQVKPKAQDLKVALVVEGAAHRRLGNFKAARDALNARLASDAQNTGALKELAKLELDIGNPEEAISALTRLVQAEERDVDAHLMRAKIAYQSAGVADGLKRAEGFLDEVLTKHEAGAGELLLPVLSHAAYVKAELGDLEKAQALAERARATDGNFAPALYVLGRIYRLKGDVDGAKKSLEAGVRAAQARDTFYEPAVRAELASAQAASGDSQNAIRNYEQVIEYDPRDTRAHFGLAATYMRSEKPTQAMTIMRRALQNDPNYHNDRRVLTDYPSAARDLVNISDIFRDAAIPRDDPSLAALKIAAEGTVRYHAGQRVEAKALFEDTLKEDRFNHAALFHLGVIALDDGLPAEAKRKLGLAIQTTGKGHAMTQLYMGRAELAAGDHEAARKRLTDLLGEEPTLVAAQYSLAMTLRALDLGAQATEELKKIVKSDQDYTPAKRALVE